MKRISKYIILATVSVFALSSCDDFFDRAPSNEISSSEYFSSENELKMYTDGLINGGLPAFTSICIGSDAFTDFCATMASTEKYLPGVYDADKSSGWSASNFSFTRRINYMIENMTKAKGNVSDEIYNHYMGVARFWRGYIHWTKVESFGNTIWLDHVVTENDSLLTSPRQDREYVMHMALADLKYAADNCLASSSYLTAGRTYVNKWVATAMLSKIALYEASYRKYHSVNPSTNVAWNNKYETSDELYRMAADAAKSIIDSKVFSLHSDYGELFRSMAIPTDEVIWSRQASTTSMHDITWRFNSATYANKYSPTKDLVDMYLKTDGTPITDDKVSMADEFTGRDNRLINTVFGPGHTWKDATGSTQLKSLDFSQTVTGYAFVKWNIEENDNYSKSTSVNSVPILRYGEVLLNYAEAKAELGEMTEDIWDETIGALRRRAGVTSIYPGSGAYVEDNWLKEYYSEDSDGPTNLSNTILEIRRERGVELCMEWASRYRDLMRWNMGNLIVRRYNNQGWKGIYISENDYKNGFSFNGTDYTFGTSNTKTSFNVSNSGANSTWSLTDSDHGYLIWNYKLEWENKMYTNPIPTSALTLSPQLGQNYGWD